MKFLVILICLALNHFWLKDHDRFDDRWFFGFRQRVEALAQRVTRNAALWQPALAMIYVVPVALLLLVLELASGRMFGLLTMLVHVAVVLVAFDRSQPGRLAKRFLELRAAGDSEAIHAFLRKEFRGTREQRFDSDDELAWFFGKHLVHRSFERMFVFFFCYVATGPLGVLVAYLTYQLRDSHGEATHRAAVTIIDDAIRLIEWIPLRLVALSFSLAGNFVQCFNQLKKSFWEFGREVDHAGLLYGFASFALFGGLPRGDTAADSGTAESSGRDHQQYQIESLQALLERCQLLWLSALALLTIFSPIV